MSLDNQNNYEMQTNILNESADREKTPEQNLDNLFLKTQQCIVEKTKENTDNILWLHKCAQECITHSENNESFTQSMVSILDKHLKAA